MKRPLWSLVQGRDFGRSIHWSKRQPKLRDLIKQAVLKDARRAARQ